MLLLKPSLMTSFCKGQNPVPERVATLDNIIIVVYVQETSLVLHNSGNCFSLLVAANAITTSGYTISQRWE
jgi:hypothetical protein